MQCLDCSLFISLRHREPKRRVELKGVKRSISVTGIDCFVALPVLGSSSRNDAVKGVDPDEDLLNLLIWNEADAYTS